MKNVHSHIIPMILLALVISLTLGAGSAFAQEVHGTVKASDIKAALDSSDKTLVLTGDTMIQMDEALSLHSIAPAKGKSHALSISGSAKLTVKNGSGKYGIRAKSLKITAKNVEASGTKAAIHADKSISIGKSLAIAKPKGGKLSADRKTIVNAKGKTAKSIQIHEADAKDKGKQKASGDAAVQANENARAEASPEISEAPTEVAAPTEAAESTEAAASTEAVTDQAAPAAPTGATPQAASTEIKEKAPAASQTATAEPQADATQSAPAGDVTPQETTFTVTFDANGQGAAPDAQTVAEGDKATRPDDPTAEGYTFGGWFTEAECTTEFDFETAITNDITLYAKWTQQEHVHALTKVAAVAVTCEKDGNIEYWHCDGCGKYYADADAAKEITQASTVVKATGHNWGAWKVVKKATATKAGKKQRTCKNDSSHVQTKSIPATGKITYSFAKNTPSTWTKGSKKTLDFTVNRNKDNKKTFSHFKSIEIDGKKLDAKYYTAKSGSLKVSVKANRLEQLSVDSHTIKVNFDDGSAKATVKVVKPTPANNSGSSANKGNSGSSGSNGSKAPATGDTMPIAVLAGVAIVAAIVGAVAFVARRRQDDSRNL